MQSALTVFNEETAARNLLTMAQEWNVGSDQIQKMLDEGYTLEEVEGVIRRSKSENIPFEQAAIEAKKRTILNKSKETESTITSDVKDVDLRENNVFRVLGLPPQPEEPKLELVRFKMDEAPYQVELEAENVSTATGALSYSETDLILPGRNGNSFALNRTYDSSSSQLYESDVTYNSVDYYDYWALVYYDVPVTRTEYYLSYSYHVYKNKFVCSTGQFLLTEAEWWEGPFNSTYSTQAERDRAYNALGTKTATEDMCKQYDRKYVQTSYLSATTSSGTVLIGYDSYYDYFGPYTTYSQALNVANSYPVGSMYRGGTVSGTGTDYDYLGSSGYYLNRLKDPVEDKRFPIGKGWSWNIPYLTFDNGTFVHLASGGTYKIENGNLKDYPWKDLSFKSDTSLIVSGLRSAYRLDSISGVKQYFDAEGKVIQISDAYGNPVQFFYTNISAYGNVLTSIIDAIGNKISITYSTSQVILTMGDRQVVYNKATKNNKEVLTQIIDPIGRVTTYDYQIRTAKFDLTGTTPITENPYALLTGVTHPTGAKTVYEFESNPVKRYTSTNSVNEAYRLASRREIITFSDNTTHNINQASFVYPTDIGSTANTDSYFSTKVFMNQLETVYNYKKDFINDQTAPMIYNTRLESSDLITRKVTDQVFDEARKIPYPISTTSYYTSNAGQSERITSSVTYDDYGNILSETDPYNNTVRYTYDPVTKLRNSEIWPVNSGLQLYVGITRNVQGDVTDYQLRNNNASGQLLERATYNYDTYGNVILSKDYDGNKEAVTTYGYNPALGSAFATSSTSTYKDIDGTVHTASTNAAYNKLTGTMASFTDPRGNLTSYLYDKLDRITKIINPDNSSFVVAYDDRANTIDTTSEMGAKTRTKWDSLGRVIESGLFINGVYNAKIKSGYDDYSRKIWEEDPNGNRVAYSYDRWDRLIRTTNADNSYSTVSFDDIANTARETDEEGNEVLRAYDKLGRVWVEKEKENGVFVSKQTNAYDNAGNLIRTQDALNNITNYHYDALGQLIGVLTPKQEQYRYFYDGFGNQTRIEFPDNRTIQKVFDERGDIISYTDETGNTKKMYYDEEGNLSVLIDRMDRRFTYSYDSKNRLLTRAGPSDSVSYTYDAEGKRTRMTDQTGTTIYAYNPYTSLLEKKTYPDSKSITFEYDLRSNRTKIVTPFNQVIDYTYDNVNRVSTVKAKNQTSASYEYYKNDKIKKVLHGNGLATEYTYDGFDLAGVQHKDSSGTVLNNYSYSYDYNGNMTSRTDHEETFSYTYDPLGRVVTSSQFNESYGYDPRGNRTSLDTSATIDFQDFTYEYDEWNRLTKVTTDDKIVIYKYNGDDQLYERTENGKTTRYYWDEDQLISESRLNGTLYTSPTTFVYGNSLLERVDVFSGSRSTYLLNGHFDVVELRDQAGNIQNKYEYDIWGKPLYKQETVSNPFRYSSEYWDDTSRLLNLGQRWYDPVTARFLQEDTFEGDLKNPLSLNLYTYAHNDPLAYSDPTGNFAFLIPLAIYAGKVIVKTAVDVTIDYTIAKSTGTKLNLGKAILSNGLSNAVPGLGEVKTARKAVKIAKTVNSVSKKAKGTGEAYNRSKHYGNTPSKKARDETLKRDNYTCQYCGSKVKPEADHNPSLKSHYQNGGKNMTQAERQKWANDPANLKTACKSCNTSKGAKNYPDQWTPADKYQGRKKGK